MKPTEYRVKFQHVEPEPMWIDFEDAHIKITGTLAFLYNAFKVMYCEDEAQTELYPWLMAAKKSGAVPADHAAQTL